MKKITKVWLVVAGVLIIDQVLKIWVKTQMSYGEEIPLFGLPWALIHFVENDGMAFGVTFGGAYGKLALSLFRIIAVGFLIYYLRFLEKAGASLGLLVSFGLILAGAVGNILDSAFYGLIFSESVPYGDPAVLFPEEGGYAPFLYGKVVDMLYFPMFSGYFPEWLPIWGGERFLFFKPVFNIADTAITLGVLNILLFQRSFFNSSPETDNMETTRTDNVSTISPVAEEESVEVENADEASTNDPTSTAETKPNIGRE